jgi:hypothetical protein
MMLIAMTWRTGECIERSFLKKISIEKKGFIAIFRLHPPHMADGETNRFRFAGKGRFRGKILIPMEFNKLHV